MGPGYSGEAEHRFRWQAERHSGAKVNSNRSAALVIVEKVFGIVKRDRPKRSGGFADGNFEADRVT